MYVSIIHVSTVEIKVYVLGEHEKKGNKLYVYTIYKDRRLELRHFFAPRNLGSNTPYKFSKRKREKATN